MKQKTSCSRKSKEQPIFVEQYVLTNTIKSGQFSTEENKVKLRISNDLRNRFRRRRIQELIKQKPTLEIGPDDMIPINYDERSTKEVLTNAIISPRSDDSKKFFEKINKLKV